MQRDRSINLAEMTSAQLAELRDELVEALAMAENGSTAEYLRLWRLGHFLSDVSWSIGFKAGIEAHRSRRVHLAVAPPPSSHSCG